jgi:hypothetical protein
VKIAYLACPYSKGTPDTRRARFEAATHVAAKLIQQGLVVFSAVTMTHPIDLILAAEGETLGSNYWITFDLSFMQACSELFVLELPGWDKSLGVSREIQFFSEQGLPVHHLKPEDYGISAVAPAFHAAFHVAET